MQDAGYAFDLYSDIDFHRGITDLSAYKALVMHTHPEYWTTQMLDRLEAYIAGGGRVLYLGGNGVAERPTPRGTPGLAGWRSAASRA